MADPHGGPAQSLYSLSTLTRACETTPGAVLMARPAPPSFCSSSQPAFYTTQDGSPGVLNNQLAGHNVRPTDQSQSSTTILDPRPLGMGSVQCEVLSPLYTPSITGRGSATAGILSTQHPRRTVQPGCLIDFNNSESPSDPAACERPANILAAGRAALQAVRDSISPQQYAAFLQQACSAEQLLIKPPQTNDAAQSLLQAALLSCDEICHEWARPAARRFSIGASRLGHDPVRAVRLLKRSISVPPFDLSACVQHALGLLADCSCEDLEDAWRLSLADDAAISHMWASSPRPSSPPPPPVVPSNNIPPTFVSLSSPAPAAPSAATIAASDTPSVSAAVSWSTNTAQPPSPLVHLAGELPVSPGSLREQPVWYCNPPVATSAKLDLSAVLAPQQTYSLLLSQAVRQEARAHELRAVVKADRVQVSVLETYFKHPRNADGRRAYATSRGMLIEALGELFIFHLLDTDSINSSVRVVMQRVESATKVISTWDPGQRTVLQLRAARATSHGAIVDTLREIDHHFLGGGSGGTREFYTITWATSTTAHDLLSKLQAAGLSHGISETEIVKQWITIINATADDVDRPGFMHAAEVADRFCGREWTLTTLRDYIDPGHGDRQAGRVVLPFRPHVEDVTSDKHGDERDDYDAFYGANGYG